MLSLMNVGNRIFEQLLMLTWAKNNIGANLANDENARWHDLQDFREELNHLSRQRLIEKIEFYEKEVAEFRRTTENKIWKLRYIDKTVTRNKAVKEIVQKEKEKVLTHEKAILGLKFDEAFHK